MILRPATERDTAQIIGFWNPLIRDTSVTFTTELKTPEGLSGDLAATAAEGRAFLVAEVAGQVLGLATWGPFRKGPGYARTGEHTVVVDPGAHGQGVGRALMQALERQAAARGLGVLVAGVSAENAGALAFHTAIGYRRVGHLSGVGHKFGRAMDLILLQKSL